MKYFCLLFFILSSPFVLAAELFEANRSIRSLGMGGIYVATVRDTDALFYNPAALGFTNKLQWKILNINAGVNGLDVYNSLSAIDSASDYSDYYGVPIWAGVSGKSAFAFPNFGFGAFSDNDLTLQLHNPAYPTFNAKFRSDYGIVVGGAISLTSNTYLGMNLKRISRWAGNQDLGISTVANASTLSLSTLKSNFQNKGVGYGIDLALMTVLDTTLHPTFAAVWKDVGITTFQKTDGASAPDPIKDNVVLGLGFNIDLPGLDMYFGAEGRHLTDSTEQIGKKLHLGTEISLPLIDLRAGVSQGYTSYGAGFSFLFLQVDAVSYSEEIGVYPGQNPQNRIQVGVSIDLSLDANFKLMELNGKKRRLKQRR
ncbi:MAG: hypothetical protein ACOYOK_00435 [Pseudobdellovibrionaceae bacterium]